MAIFALLRQAVKSGRLRGVLSPVIASELPISGLIHGGATESLGLPLESCWPGSCRGQTVDGAGKSEQGAAVKDEVGTDRYANKVGAGCRPGGQQEDAEPDGD